MYFLSTSYVLLLRVEGAIKNFWGFEATLFIDIELRKCTSKYIQVKIISSSQISQKNINPSKAKISLMAPSKLCTAQCLQYKEQTDKSTDSNLSFTSRLLHYLGLQIHQGLNLFCVKFSGRALNSNVLIIISKENPLGRFQDFLQDDLTRDHGTVSYHSGYNKK